MLLQTNFGVLNTDHIVSIEAVPGSVDRGRSAIRFFDGSERVIPLPVEHFEQAAGTIIRAQPGFLMVSTLLDEPQEIAESGIHYIEEPVIAFRIVSGDKPPVPITIRGEPEEHPDYFYTVQQPNGRCAGPDGIYGSIAEFKSRCELVATCRDQGVQPFPIEEV